MINQPSTLQPAISRLYVSMPLALNRYPFLSRYEPSSSNSNSKMNKFQKTELQLFRKLSPEKIQKYLDDLPYNKEKDGETCYSPRLVLRHNTAHCFEGALFAAAALRVGGRPPLILDLEAV